MSVLNLIEKKNIVSNLIDDELLKSFLGLEYYGVIYEISNDVNNKVYVGKTRRFYYRASEHVRAILDSKYDNRSSSYLYQSIREIGISHFKMKAIDIAFSAEELSDKEVRRIVDRKSILKEFGYNITVDRLSYENLKEKYGGRKKEIKADERRKKSIPILAVNLDKRIAIFSDSAKLLGEVIIYSNRSVISYAAKYCRTIKGYYFLYLDIGRISEKITMTKRKRKHGRKDYINIASNYFQLYKILKNKNYDNLFKLCNVYELRYDDNMPKNIFIKNVK